VAKKPDSMLKDYFQALFDAGKRGDAREETLYGPLQALVNQFADARKLTGVDVVTLPKKTEAGNPDFRVWDGRSRVVGYIEAKMPGTVLDQAETSEQLKRYLHTFPNVILTDFYEFRLYRDGQRIERVVSGRPFVAQKLNMPSVVSDADGLKKLFDAFFSFSLPRKVTAKTLAVELAKRTRFLRDQVVAEELKEQEAKKSGDIFAFYEAFHEFLIADLTLEDFADLYSQTIAYGMFAARTRTSGEFTRRDAYERIPRTVGILRDVFRFISLEEVPEALKWMVDDIAQVLSAADVKKILERFYREGKGRDPIVHFYETFLAEYDPAERERRGVYYTPEPVVGYIVRSIHKLLKEKFGKADGLADPGVTLLDPAAGTMTFVAEAARVASEEYEEKYGKGAKADFIRENVLEHFYAFELMMAPYAVGHLKMSFMLEEFGYRLKEDDRFKLYLTNTLEFEDLEQTDLPGMRSLSEESRLAGKVKKKQPILVILGNPPYSGISTNKGKWITDLIEDYKQVDGKHFGERKHWLQDDYVKFLRFAQWKIDQAGEGIVGMITNHGYLDNPTFRGMRQSLMTTFDEIYVVNLHGNSLKKEVCPDGSKDENVFDIRQGVAIALFVKGTGEKTVKHHERFGLREDKYAWLDADDVKKTEWETLDPESPFYFFTPKTGSQARYDEFLAMPEIFPVHVAGIVTARDRFVVDIDRAALLRRIAQFRDLSMPDSVVRRGFGLKDTRGWKLPEKRKLLAKDEEWRDKAQTCLYRPFDTRWLYYHRDMVDWGRERYMYHMSRANIAISTARTVETGSFTHALCTAEMITHHTVSLKEVNYLFPLFLYEGYEEDDLFAAASKKVRRTNIEDKLNRQLQATYGHRVAPEHVMAFVYAVLYSPAYREKYDENLKSEFPRIPFTADSKVFDRVAGIGERLIALHLMKSKSLDAPVCRFDGDGDGRVAKNKAAGRRYDAETQRVFINREQYFSPVPDELWSYTIGGYQVLDKWLKDRAERRLSSADIKRYCRVATALAETMKIQVELAEVYPDVEQNLIVFAE